MNDALKLLAMVRRDRQDVVVAVHGRVGVAQDGTELRVAEELFDLVLDTVFQGRELLSNFGKLGARGVDDMTAAVDAAGDGLANRPKVLDRGKQLDQPDELAVEPHPVPIEGPGRGQRVGDFKEL